MLQTKIKTRLNDQCTICAKCNEDCNICAKFNICTKFNEDCKNESIEEININSIVK